MHTPIVNINAERNMRTEHTANTIIPKNTMFIIIIIFFLEIRIRFSMIIIKYETHSDYMDFSLI